MEVNYSGKRQLWDLRVDTNALKVFKSTDLKNKPLVILVTVLAAIAGLGVFSAWTATAAFRSIVKSQSDKASKKNQIIKKVVNSVLPQSTQSTTPPKTNQSDNIVSNEGVRTSVPSNTVPKKFIPTNPPLPTEKKADIVYDQVVNGAIRINDFNLMKKEDFLKKFKLDQPENFSQQVEKRAQEGKETGYYFFPNLSKQVVLIEKKEDIYKIKVFNEKKERGRGNFGVVHEVVNVFDRKKVYALKRPHEGAVNLENESKMLIQLYGGDYEQYKTVPEYRKEFRKEAKKIGGLQELPHHLQCDGEQGHLMPLCDGNIEDYTEHASLQLPIFVSMISQLLEGLAHIHNQQLVHCDLLGNMNPNILYKKNVEGTPSFYIADFGLMKEANDPNDVYYHNDIVGLGGELIKHLLNVNKNDPNDPKLSKVGSTIAINTPKQCDKLLEGDLLKDSPYRPIVEFLRDMMQPSDSPTFKNGQECLDAWNKIKQQFNNL